MKAVRIHAQGDLRVEDVPAPTVGPGKVLLSGGFTGICGSDLHLYYAPESFPWDFSRPAKLTGATWPQILGHEFSGTVSEVGEGVTEVTVGDNVAVFPYHYCGECFACRSGDYTACVNMAFEGIQGVSGGMAETKIADARDCFVLPSSVDLKQGALVEPMAVAWHGVTLSQPEADGGALVVGGGPIGVGAYYALRAQGVKTIVVSETSAERRELLRSLGVEHLVDPASEDLVQRVRELNDGMGASVAIDCAGAPAALAGELAALGLHGRLVVVAAYEKPVELSFTQLSGGKTVRTSAVYTREDFAGVIEAMDKGLYDPDAGWVETAAFENVEGAIHDLRNGKGMKLLVETPLRGRTA